ncbi:MAG: hypothetical protein K1X28_10460 [Parachlamydiales bacterium]|nr:hypothetical protein [Parachlamydiales bacterium]
MRMLDDVSDKSINMLSLLLTESEALELIGCLEGLIKKKDFPKHHSHLMSYDYKKEIMICLYEPGKNDNFHPRIQKLILSDE